MNRRYILVGCFLVVALVGGMLVLRRHLGADVPAVEVEPTGKVMGPSNAPIQIVEYSDYQCPACSHAHKIVNNFLERYPGKIQLVFRHFPLRGHQWSPLAHQAAECAQQQNRFWQYHDRLFTEQKKWSTPRNPMEQFFLYAKELKLDLDVFASCLRDKEVRQHVLDDRNLGKALKITSTPTFFINGERLVGGKQLIKIGEAIIREALGLPPKEVTDQPVPEKKEVEVPRPAATRLKHPRRASRPRVPISRIRPRAMGSGTRDSEIETQSPRPVTPHSGR